MPISAWLRPPRHLVVLFLGITLVLMATLVWLGARLLQQDRALERQRVQDRLERVADRVAAVLTRRLADTEDSLAQLSVTLRADLTTEAEDYATHLGDDALVVVLSADGLESFPEGRLLYYPVTTTGVEPPASLFAAGEAAEFRARDLARAGRLFQSLAQSDDPAIRAGALLRLARIHRKANRPDAALETYADLAALHDTPVNQLPAELVARFARLQVLEALSRVDELRQEADSLHADLERGRWRIIEATYQLYRQQLADWVGSGADVETTSPVVGVALAEGVEQLWEEWQRSSRGAGRRIVWVDDEPMLLVWVSGPESTAGLVAGPGQLSSWLDGVEPTFEAEGVTLAIADVEGRPIIAKFAEQPEMQATRAPPESGLPLTVQVVSASLDADFAQFAERRRLLLLGMSVVAMLVLLGLYAVMRGVTRELEAARLQSNFVSAVSHEFRTPLTSMRQLTELLASGRVASDERREHYYAVIKRESERLHRLVEGLLDFGRMEAGALEFQLEDVDSNSLVRDVVEEFQQEAGEHGCEIVLNGGGESCTIRVDEEAMKRALWNLLDNAVKYSPDCNTVWVDETREDEYFAVRVRDRGVGIAPSDRQAIFEKFFRVKRSDHGSVEGTGIGLAMVRHIVESHGGEIRVESEPGAGSTFTILLPVGNS